MGSLSVWPSIRIVCPAHFDLTSSATFFSTASPSLRISARPEAKRISSPIRMHWNPSAVRPGVNPSSLPSATSLGCGAAAADCSASFSRLSASMSLAFVAASC